MKCTKYQFENPESSKFYLECGEKLEVTCSNYGQVLKSKAHLL